MYRRFHKRISVASPYYDRLRSLHIQIMEVAYGSPEYIYISRQILELEHRAMLRMITGINYGIRPRLNPEKGGRDT